MVTNQTRFVTTFFVFGSRFSARKELARYGDFCGKLSYQSGAQYAGIRKLKTEFTKESLFFAQSALLSAFLPDQNHFRFDAVILISAALISNLFWKVVPTGLAGRPCWVIAPAYTSDNVNPARIRTSGSVNGTQRLKTVYDSNAMTFLARLKWIIRKIVGATSASQYGIFTARFIDSEIAVFLALSVTLKMRQSGQKA